MKTIINFINHWVYFVVVKTKHLIRIIKTVHEERKKLQPMADSVTAEFMFSEQYENEFLRFMPEPTAILCNVYCKHRMSASEYTALTASEKRAYHKKLNKAYASACWNSNRWYMKVFAPIWYINNLFLAYSINIFTKYANIYSNEHPVQSA